MNPNDPFGDLQIIRYNCSLGIQEIKSERLAGIRAQETGFIYHAKEFAFLLDTIGSCLVV